MSIINLAQIIIAVILTVLILMQSQNSGLTGGASSGESYHTRRGMEKIVFKSTIILVVVFTVLSILALV